MENELEELRERFIQVLSDTIKLVEGDQFEGGAIMVNITLKEGGLRGAVAGGDMQTDVIKDDIAQLLFHILEEEDNNAMLN